MRIIIFIMLTARVWEHRFPNDDILTDFTTDVCLIFMVLYILWDMLKKYIKLPL